MSDRIAEALSLLEEATPSTEFRDSLFERIVADLNLDSPVVVERTGPVEGKSQRWLRPRIAIAFGLALAVAITGTILLVPAPPSALAVIREARADFSKLPPYHAKTRLEANDNSSSPDFEMVVETEDWYSSTSKWRTQILSSTRTGDDPGSFRVSNGTDVGEYDTSTNIFRLRPLDELEDPVSHTPSYFFDPSFLWWGTGSQTELTKPSDTFFAQNCDASQTQFIGRSASKLVCKATPEDIHIWVDDQTGMLLKVRHFDIQREIRSIDIRPTFGAQVLDITAPEGALLRWEGKGAPPPGYEARIGESVAATYPGGVYAGSLTVGSKSLWYTAMVRPEPPYTSQIVRMDPSNGEILATIPMPDRVQVAEMVEAAGHLWVLQSTETNRAATLQRVDLATNKLIHPVIDLGRDPSGLTFADGALWATAGKPVPFEVGRAEGDFIPISRIDPKTFEVTSYDIQLVPTGDLVAEGGALFTPGFRPQASGENDQYVVVRFDLGQRKVTAETPLDAFPNQPVPGFGSVWLTTPDAGGNSNVLRIDASSTQVTKIPSGKGSGSIAIGRDAVWVSNFEEDAVLKIDPTSNQISSRITLGPAPAGSVVGFGSLWVVFGTGTDQKIARILIE